MSSMTEITCKCGCERKKMVRTADVKRGWGKYYSKSCKAKQQEKSTGQHKAYVQAHQHSIDDDIVLDDASYGASDGGGYYDLNGRPL